MAAPASRASLTVAKTGTGAATAAGTGSTRGGGGARTRAARGAGRGGAGRGGAGGSGAGSAGIEGADAPPSAGASARTSGTGGGGGGGRNRVTSTGGRGGPGGTKGASGARIVTTPANRARCRAKLPATASHPSRRRWDFNILRSAFGIDIHRLSAATEINCLPADHSLASGSWRRLVEAMLGMVKLTSSRPGPVITPP